MEYKQIHHFPFDDEARVSWNASRTTADVYFVTADGTAIVLTMTAERLRMVRADIDAALSHKPRATPDR